MSPALIELLPPELLDEIISYLSFQDTIRLVEGSNRLLRRLRAVLLGSGSARSHALGFTCKNGLRNVFHAALDHGASISFVSVPTSNGTTSSKTLTLQLAAERRHVDLFRELILLGARVDGGPSLTDATVRLLIKRMCAPVDSALLRPFLQAGLAEQLDQVTRNRALIAVAGSPDPAAVGFARQLLDAGADPSACFLLYKGSESVVSAALLSGRLEMVELMLSGGATIHGLMNPFPKYLSDIPCHVPLCAAVLAMAAPGGDASLLHRCLDLGADINVRIPIAARDLYHCHGYTDALLLYLDAVPRWDTGGKAALDNLRVLFRRGFEIHHASAPDEACPSLVRHGEVMESPTAFEVLMDKHGVEHLAHPAFVAAVQLVIRAGALAQHTGQILGPYQGAVYGAPPPAAVVRGWRAVLAAVIDPATPREGLDAVLHRCLFDRKRLYFRGDYQGGLGPFAGSLTRETVLALVAAGADPNAVVDPGGPTPLQVRCWWHAACNGSQALVRWIGYAGSGRPTPGKLTAEQAGFLKFLVAQGADARSTWQGKRPAQVLLAALERRERNGAVEEWERGVVEDVVRVFRGGSGC